MSDQLQQYIDDGTKHYLLVGDISFFIYGHNQLYEVGLWLFYPETKTAIIT